MTEISEKEVRAVADVLLGRVNAPEQEIYRAARDALQAAALARAEANAGEPVAWAYDWTDDGGETQTAASTQRVVTVNFEPVRNVRPLYTHPAPQQSGTVEVKPLEWETRDPYGAIWFARTACGAEYRVMHEQWWSPDSTRANPCFSNDEAKAAAQADYERRILSALTAGKPEQECATEGCDKPATVHFERGGIGSHYCHDCYLKVQAVATPPTAGGGDE